MTNPNSEPSLKKIAILGLCVVIPVVLLAIRWSSPFSVVPPTIHSLFH